MRLPEYLVDHPDGEIRLSGHRIGLYDVVSHYKDGESVEGLCERFPSLPSALVRDVVDFYQKNQIDVDDYVSGYQAELERQRSTSPQTGPSLSEMRRRLEQIKREQVH